MTFKYTMLLSCALVCAPISFTQASSSLPFQGINLSADETGQDGWGSFSSTERDIMPTLAEAFYDPTNANFQTWSDVPVGTNGESFQSIGMNTVRLPFRWDYLFHDQTSIDDTITAENLNQRLMTPTSIIWPSKSTIS